jgi:hypothetical protein
MRVARTKPQPRSISRDAPNGKASADRSASVRDCRSRRAFGPITGIIARAWLMSVTVANSSGPMCRFQPVPVAARVAGPESTRNRVSSSRVTVTSASIPPRELSHWV